MPKGVYKRKEETRKKISKGNKGKKRTDKMKENYSKSKLGNKNPMYGKHTSQKQKNAARETCKKRQKEGRYQVSEETKKKLRKINIGKKLTEEHKEKIRQKNKGRSFGYKFPKGEKNPSYIDGKSKEPYGIEFNNELKEWIRKRDNHRCQECFRHQDELFRNTKAGIRPCKLCVHHIDYDKKNNRKNNLISLCLKCHSKVHYRKKEWKSYFQLRIVQKT